MAKIQEICAACIKIYKFYYGTSVTAEHPSNLQVKPTFQLLTTFFSQHFCEFLLLFCDLLNTQCLPDLF